MSYYKLGDKVVLKNIEPFTEYNDKEFTIIQIYAHRSFKVKRDGFDPIWVTSDNFVKKGE
jgi:hypothetical protein